MAEDVILDEEEKVNSEYDLKEIDSVRDALRKLPAAISHKAKSILELDIVKGEIIKKTKTIEFDTERKVSLETKEIDVEDKVDKRSMSKEEKEIYKPTFHKENVQKYSNEMMRKAEVQARLINNKEFKEYNNKADRLDKTVSETNIELSFMKRVYRSAESLSRIGVE